MQTKVKVFCAPTQKQKIDNFYSFIISSIVSFLYLCITINDR